MAYLLKKYLLVIVVSLITFSSYAIQPCSFHTDVDNQFTFFESKLKKTHSVKSLDRNIELKQYLSEIDLLPNEFSECFLSLKEDSKKLSVEKGVIIAIYDDSTNASTLITSNKERSISFKEVRKTISEIKQRSKNKQIFKIITVHTHPPGEDSIRYHSHGDLYANLRLLCELSDEPYLDDKVKLESIVIPLHRDMDNYFVVGKMKAKGFNCNFFEH